jgi:glycine/D-amino acid oxidase-like deaminating enzyme
VVVLEKGRIAGEQSSRNLGWVRKTSRAASDVPMSLASDRLWAQMPERLGADVGYRQAGIMFLGATEKDMAMHEGWLASVKDWASIAPADPGPDRPAGARRARNMGGGIYTPSDGRAEPALAASAIAAAAIRQGAVIVENCAVRALSLTAGQVRGLSPNGAKSAAIRCFWQAPCGRGACWAITA